MPSRPRKHSASGALACAREFLRFLRRIERAVLPYLDVHLICDNYSTHKTPEVQTWLNADFHRSATLHQARQ